MSKGSLDGDGSRYLGQRQLEKGKDLLALISLVVVLDSLNDCLSKIHIWEEECVEVLIAVILVVSLMHLLMHCLVVYPAQSRL